MAVAQRRRNHLCFALHPRNPSSNLRCGGSFAYVRKKIYRILLTGSDCVDTADRWAFRWTRTAVPAQQIPSSPAVIDQALVGRSASVPGDAVDYDARYLRWPSWSRSPLETPGAMGVLAAFCVLPSGGCLHRLFGNSVSELDALYGRKPRYSRERVRRRVEVRNSATPERRPRMAAALHTAAHRRTGAPHRAGGRVL